MSDDLMSKLQAMNNPTALYNTAGTHTDDSNGATDAVTKPAGSSTENSAHHSDSVDDGGFNAEEFLGQLDSLFATHAGPRKIEEFLEQAQVDAENAQDSAGLLTVLNETMGFNRSQSKHQENQWIVQRALELAIRMGLQGSEAWTTTLINAATAMRAAKNYDQARDLYAQAADSAKATYGTHDRRLAALYNNMSMLGSETGDYASAEKDLRQALEILRSATTDPAADIDVASTCTNLALVLLDEAKSVEKKAGASASLDTDSTGNKPKSGSQSAIQDLRQGTSPAVLLAEADEYAQSALQIYRKGHLENSAHYASALAGAAQTALALGKIEEAVKLYRHSLEVIARCYGTDNDYYRITEHNLKKAESQLSKESQATPTSNAPTSNVPTSPSAPTSNAPTSPSAPTPYRKGTINSAFSIEGASAVLTTIHQDERLLAQAVPEAPTGLQLSKGYWQDVVKPMIKDQFPDHFPSIAAGLVGHGSECFGFDDAISHDHDFGPRVCLWLTAEDYAEIGEDLQKAYDALPKEYKGYGLHSSERTPRAQGESRRDGVFEIGAFFTNLTGYPTAPPANKPHEWLLLDEATLATATNGRVFADGLGAFSKTRQSFTFMPDDVRLSLISRRLGMISQAGQVNFPRMIARQDGAAAWLCLQEFTTAVSSAIFLLNNPVTVGYLPYYKWQFAALRKLSRRPAMMLTDVCAQLEDVLRLGSAACFGGPGTGEGDKGAAPALQQVAETIENICAQIAQTLHDSGLTISKETFLEWQRPYVEAHIRAKDPILRSI